MSLSLDSFQFYASARFFHGFHVSRERERLLSTETIESSANRTFRTTQPRKTKETQSFATVFFFPASRCLSALRSHPPVGDKCVPRNARGKPGENRCNVLVSQKKKTPRFTANTEHRGNKRTNGVNLPLKMNSENSACRRWRER